MTDISFSNTHAASQKDLIPITNNIHSKYKVKEEFPVMMKKGNPLKGSCSNSYYLHLSKTWDSVYECIHYLNVKGKSNRQRTYFERIRSI